MKPKIPQVPCASIETTGFDSSADDAWFSHHTAPMDGEEETGAHSYQSQALHEYLLGRSTPSAATSILCSSRNPAESAEDLRTRVFALLQSAFFELPRRYTPSLISLLVEISESGDPNWRGLPGFATSWADMWKQPHWRSALATRDPATRTTRREAWVHRAFVEASCAMAVPSPTAENGLPPLSWGYECISDALECQHAVWDFEVPAAAMWVKIAGKRLRDGADKGETSWALEREGRLRSAGPISLERWEFWMRRFAEMEDIGNAVANAASEGVKGMGR